MPAIIEYKRIPGQPPPPPFVLSLSKDVPPASRSGACASTTLGTNGGGDRGGEISRAAFLRLLAGGLAGAILSRPALAAPTYDFWFTRLRYDSGDWDVDQRMPSNLITSLIDYTTLRVDPKERVVALADPKMLTAPFCYMAGHKLVEFSAAERRNFETYVRNGGFVLADDCNHDIDGLFAKSFEAQMAKIFGPKALKRLPNTHPIYRSFSKFLARRCRSPSGNRG